MFAHIKQARWQTIVIFVLAHNALKVLFFSDLFLGLAAPVQELTGGVLTITHLSYLIEMVLLVGGLLFVVEGMRLVDVGLRAGDIGNALIVLTGLWGLVQVVSVAFAHVTGSPVVLSGALWAGAGARLGRIVETWFGSALFEEIMYRGLLVPQLYLLASRWWPESPERRLAFALVVVQAYFGVNHLWAGQAMGLTGLILLGYVLHVALTGLLFAAFYIRSGNLLVAVGVHALLNYPASLILSPIEPAMLVLVIACLILLAWPYLSRLSGSVFTMHPVASRLLWSNMSGGRTSP